MEPPSRNLSLSDETETEGEIYICFSMTAAYFEVARYLKWYIANIVVNILLAFAATLENILILLAIWRTPSLKTPSNMLLFGLGLSDLGVGLLAQPLAITNTIAKIQGLTQVSCLTGAAVAALSTYFGGVSLLSVTAVSVDRYLALYLHLRYKQMVTNNRVIALLVCIWIFVALTLLMGLLQPQPLLVTGVVVGCLCIIISLFCFLQIYFVLRRHHKQIRQQTLPEISSETNNDNSISTRYTRSVVSMFVVYILLLFCFLPYLSSASLMAAQGLNVTNRLLFELARTIVYANSSINPAIYCWRLHDIRAAVIRLIPRSI